MELFNDSLVFDDRTRDDLFDKNHPRQPLYVDILKRWSMGNSISKVEQKIVADILVFYPEYVIKNDKTNEFIELIRHSLKQIDLQNPENPEKGLFLYTLFYLLLRNGNPKEALPLLDNLKNVFIHYEKAGIEIFKKESPEKKQVIIFYLDPSDEIDIGDKTTKAYIEIISRIIDLKELLFLYPGFSFNELPLPRTNFNDNIYGSLRSSALSLYKEKLYLEAIKKYNLMLIARNEIPGTLIHKARIELTLGNIDKVKLHTEMAWRHRENASPYVIARILWFKLCLCLLEVGNKKEIPLIIGQIKTLLQDEKVIMEWTMDVALECLKPKLNENEHALLTALVAAMSNKENLEKLNEFPEWKNADPKEIE